MKEFVSISLLSVCLALLSFNVNAQDTTNHDTSVIRNLITADKLSSGNYKDVLTSFFQLALNDLTGPEKEISFTSNLYALRLKSNADLSIDKNYTKPFTTFCRNTNINWHLKVDSSYRFNGFSFDLKYAIINRRDYTISKTLIPRMKQLMAAGDSIQEHLSMAEGKIISSNPQRYHEINSQINGFLQDSIMFSQLDPVLQQATLPVLQKYFTGKSPDSLRLHAYEKKQYDSIVSTYQNKLLWTLDAQSTTYTNRFFFSNVDITTEALKGVVNPQSIIQIELDLKASLNLSNDSLTSRNLKRSIFSGEGGLNLVVKNTARSHSIAELKLTTAWNDILSGKYEGEDNSFFTLNGTLRFRITDSFWIPLSISYDPRTGNVFGFLSITSNFTWLNSVLKHL